MYASWASTNNTSCVCEFLRFYFLFFAALFTRLCLCCRRFTEAESTVNVVYINLQLAVVYKAICVCAKHRYTACTVLYVMCAGALSAGAQREAVLRPLSLPIPLQVHMCFISRPAHRTVNSNGGLAWGYSQPPGRDGKTAGKKMTSMGEIIPPVFTFSRLFFFFFPCLFL